MQEKKYNNIVRILMSMCFPGTYTQLSEIKKFLRTDGNPHEKLKVYHVAGTNGKGSTCAMIANVLYKEFGLKVGMTASPHIVTVNDRIQVNGVYISDNDLVRIASDVYLRTRELKLKLGYFSLVTMIAIYYFLEQGVDCIVMEVGLGGKGDATNIWDRPLATAITSIGLDHLRLLGPSLTQIQRHKMGIMKPGVPCYTPVDNKLMHYGAHVKKADLHIVTGTTKTNMLGEHQEKNARIVHDMLSDQGYDQTKIKRGLQSVSHPGRLQLVRPRLLIDGAHNYQGLAAINKYIEGVRDQYDTIITVFGTIKSEKDFKKIKKYLIKGEKNHIIPLRLRRESTISMQTMTQEFPFPVQIGQSIEELLPQLEKQVEGTNSLVLVYGSLFLMGQVLRTMN